MALILKLIVPCVMGVIADQKACGTSFVGKSASGASMMQLNRQSPEPLTRNDSRLAGRPESSIPIFPKQCGVGGLVPQADMPEVCVAMPNIQGSADTSGTLAEFTCGSGASAACTTKCQANRFIITRAILSSDEDIGRQNNSAYVTCGRKYAIQDGQEKSYRMDYYCGCADGEVGFIRNPAAQAETFINQNHDATSASCGIVKVGIQVYVLAENGWGQFPATFNNATWNKVEPNEDSNGVVNSDIYFGGDLANVIKEVRAGTRDQGAYRQSYTKNYPEGCQVSYKIDFTVGNWSTATTQQGGSSSSR